jgi:hypothetical protein
MDVGKSVSMYGICVDNLGAGDIKRGDENRNGWSGKTRE